MPLSQTSSGAPHSFEDAVTQYKVFLRQQQWPEVVRWLTHDDILAYGNRCWVRLGNMREAELEAEATYNQAVKEGVGISLNALGVERGVTIAAAFKASATAPPSSCTEFHLAVPRQRTGLVKRVRNPLYWCILRSSLRTVFSDERTVRRGKFASLLRFFLWSSVGVYAFRSARSHDQGDRWRDIT